MSETLACVIAFVFFVLVILVFVLLWLTVKFPTPTLRQVMDLYWAASTWHERVIVVYLTSLIFLKAGFFAFLATFSAAGFACLGAICSPSSLPVLRQILLDFYAFFERLLTTLSQPELATCFLRESASASTSAPRVVG